MRVRFDDVGTGDGEQRSRTLPLLSFVGALRFRFETPLNIKQENSRLLLLIQRMVSETTHVVIEGAMATTQQSLNRIRKTISNLLKRTTSRHTGKQQANNNANQISNHSRRNTIDQQRRFVDRFQRHLRVSQRNDRLKIQPFQTFKKRTIFCVLTVSYCCRFVRLIG